MPNLTLELKLHAALIYIVDDEVRNLRLLERLLNKHGYSNIACAQDGETLQAMVAAKVPDLLLLDLNLPEVSGLELLDKLELLRTSSPPVPVLVLTGDSRTDIRREALQKGARDFVTKPFDPPEVLCRIRNLLETRVAQCLLLEQYAGLEWWVKRLQTNGNSASQRLKLLGTALSHDLNNYTGAIQGYTELAKFELEGQQEALSYLDCILESCGKVRARTKMLENFAENERIEGQACDLNELLTDLAAMFQGLHYSPEPQPCYVLGDRDMLEQVFHQLHMNAKEASPHDSPVVLRLRRQGGEIAAMMEDCGSGLDESLGEDIFDPYVSTKGKGRGFGLSWARGWMGRMGGRIEIRSRSPQAGTEVTVWARACDGEGNAA